MPLNLIEAKIYPGFVLPHEQACCAQMGQKQVYQHNGFISIVDAHNVWLLVIYSYLSFHFLKNHLFFDQFV